ncbi:MAG: hypothetical protein H7318_17985 [Oligoflexus sp.]|nr:hypothetical protein [Oligoflexus sp.]
MRISSSLILLSLLSVNTSCGKWAKANSEQVQTMQRPTYPHIDGDVFTLNSSKNSTSYKGTIFLANDSASVEDFAALINVSVASRQAWGEMKTFETDSEYLNLYSDLNGLAVKQLDLMKDGLKAFETSALARSPIGMEAKLANVDTWIDREIASLSLDADKKTAFDRSWGEYCEAKIIEFAAHPFLSQNTFKLQPVPAPLCKKYYADHSFLTSPDCVSPTGDYLKCIWIDGVAKTRWFVSTSEVSDPALATAREDKRSKLKDLFSDANYEATRGALGFVETSFVFTGPTDPNKSKYFVNKETFLNLALGQKTDAVCATVIASAGSQDLCRIFGISLETRSPLQVINAVEGVAPNEKIFAKLPLPPAPRVATTQQIIRYLNDREGLNTSESDRLFNELKSGVALQTPGYLTAGKKFQDLIPEMRATLAAEFYGALSEDDLTRRSSQMVSTIAQEKLIEGKRTEWNRLNDNITTSTEKGITIANRPGFGRGFVQYSMTYAQFGNVLSAQFSFAGHLDHAFRACFDLEKSQSIACPGDLPLSSGVKFHEATLTKASDGGKIEFSFVISPAVEIGMGPKPRVEEGQKPDFFMDLSTSETEGRTLRFELYRTRLGSYMDIMTGKAFIEEAGKRKYEAGISMWEQSE